MDTVTGVGVIDKAIEILRAVADRPAALGAIQSATGLPRATAHRLAVALEAHGLLRRDDEGRFDLGPELAALGRIADQRFPLVELARPALTRLRDDTGESVQLFVREGAQRRCVLSLPSPHALRWIVPDGARLPLELGSAGRVLSGELGPQGWVASVEEREAGVASVERAGAVGARRPRRRGEHQRSCRTVVAAAGGAVRESGRRRRGPDHPALTSIVGSIVAAGHRGGSSSGVTNAAPCVLERQVEPEPGERGTATDELGAGLVGEAGEVVDVEGREHRTNREMCGPGALQNVPFDLDTLGGQTFAVTVEHCARGSRRARR